MFIIVLKYPNILIISCHILKVLSNFNSIIGRNAKVYFLSRIENSFAEYKLYYLKFVIMLNAFPSSNFTSSGASWTVRTLFTKSIEGCHYFCCYKAFV